MLLINDKRLVGDLANSRTYNFLGWSTVTLITAAVLVMFGAQIYGLLTGGG